MDHLQRLRRQLSLYLFLWFVVCAGTVCLGWLVGQEFLHISWPLLVIIISLVSVGLAWALAVMAAWYVSQPVEYIWQAILHVSPEHNGTGAPNVEQSRVGHELVASLVAQVYQLASSPVTNIASAEEVSADHMVLSNFPLPVILVDKNQNITYVNAAAQTFLALKAEDLLQKNVYSMLDILFPNEQTLDSWLNDSRLHKVTDSHSWERVRLKLGDQTTRQFDLAAHYSKDSPNGTELILAIFDHSNRYNLDDQAMSYVAIAVHELRTPLTILRGYIEVFEEELAGKLSPELNDFMHKMKASAQQLSAFVSNILNVARIEENQLVLHLGEEKWEDIIRGAVSDLSLRAQVHGKTIECEVAPNLPTVAAERVSIYEVISNLIDNAIKYSAKSNKIMVKVSLTTDGLVQTNIQDFGVGIPMNVMPNIFDKFYRNHRNRAQIGGTGLGLYLSKAIVTAHGGNIWVQSKEGQGTTFSFTLVPYSQLADALKNQDNTNDIVRGAHGWIKNHSLYRR